MEGSGQRHAPAALYPRIYFYVELQRQKSKGVLLHAMEAHGGERRCSSYSYLTSATRWGWVVSVMPRPRFTPGERTPSTHWIGGWLGLRAGLNAGARRKIICPCWGLNLDHPIVQPIVRHYTAWATVALCGAARQEIVKK
jgi:hypothetical protein